MIDPVVGQGTLQRLGDVLLADDLGKRVRSVAAVERERGAAGARSVPGSSNSASSWVCSIPSGPGSESRRSSSPASSTHAPYARMVTARSWFYSIQERIAGRACEVADFVDRPQTIRRVVCALLLGVGKRAITGLIALLRWTIKTGRLRCRGARLGAV